MFKMLGFTPNITTTPDLDYNINNDPCITINQTCGLTELGIFWSSIILSSSAFIVSVLSQIQKSKCRQINCLGSNCIRESV